MHIILFQPQIPQNTGNIVRTCSVTNTKLSLIKPLGFSISNKRLKRAGLDYWDEVEITTFDSIEEALEQIDTPVYFFSSKSKRSYTTANFTEGATLVFGSETTGLPPYLFEKYASHFYTIPMAEGTRCLNLATSAGIVLYEALRQRDFSFSKSASGSSL